MILKTLTLCDFGLFQGRHAFDLTPHRRYGHTRPIILFGGLNGSGKTTLLTAIRLAFYGKQSLGQMVSKKSYQQFLQEAIHRNRHDLVSPQTASIEVTFMYARQGELNEYQIRRTWSVLNGEIQETLTIACDGEALQEFSSEAGQAFLNELIPLGVSDLFFFDGEKIAELAEDETGEILQQAVRKLLGLDLIERLRNDLAIYLRQQKETVSPENTHQELQLLDISYQETLAKKDREVTALLEMRKQIKKLREEIAQLESLMNEDHGPSANTREMERAQMERLIVDKERLENQQRELLGGAFPLSLVQNQLTQLLQQLERDTVLKKRQGVTEVIQDRLSQLPTTLATAIPPQYVNVTMQTIEDVFADWLVTSDNGNNLIIHDLSETTGMQIRHWITDLIPRSVGSFQTITTQLQQVSEELEQVSVRLERASDTSTFKANLYVLNNKNQQLGELQAKSEQHLEKAKAWLREAMEINRQMQSLHEQTTKTWKENKAIVYASQARNLLEEFSARTTQRRLVELEDEFTQAFQRLSRKTDTRLRARIDAETFHVTLFDDRDIQMTKSQLSAGEKQIFAIAILEALARTSGRKLPIIIDTPLGRLDSKHRSKLVQHYFPQASHQVIILSTDTEIDRDFYQSLSPNISRAFHLEYDPVNGCSVAQQGYFWRVE